MTIRMPATTMDVKVESRATGNYIIFKTQDGFVEVAVGVDVLRAIGIMRKCKQLLQQRGQCGHVEEG